MKRLPELWILGGLCGAVFLAALVALHSRRSRDGRFVDVPGRPGQYKTNAEARAARRAYDGAPPVIPHPSFNMACLACHTDGGLFVPDVGFAPAMPHAETPGLSRVSNCVQCHVFRQTDAVLVESSFEGRPQDLRKGSRMYPHAPPRVPHAVFMREACAACHAGPAIRESIRCTHPERFRCSQCHVPALTADEFP